MILLVTPNVMSFVTHFLSCPQKVTAALPFTLANPDVQVSTNSRHWLALLDRFIRRWIYFVWCKPCRASRIPPTAIIGLNKTYENQNILHVVPLTEHTNFVCWGAQWRGWFRHCATGRKIAGSIPDCVTGIFHWHKPAGRNMALRSTQPPTETCTRNIS